MVNEREMINVPTTFSWYALRESRGTAERAMMVDDEGVREAEAAA